MRLFNDEIHFIIFYSSDNMDVFKEIFFEKLHKTVSNLGIFFISYRQTN